MASEQINWNAWVPIEKAGTNAEGDMLLSGPVASDVEDFDGDILEKAGIWKGLDLFEKLGGQVDWCHLWKKTHNPGVIIGKAVERTLVDGTPWLCTKLRKGLKLAQEVYQYYNDGMKLGYSIDGVCLGRDKNNPKRITDTAITMVTLAPQTKGFDQYVVAGGCPASLGAIAKALADDDMDALEELSTFVEFDDYEKALTTDSGVVVPGQTGGATLRRQELLPKLSTATFGGRRRRRKSGSKVKIDPLAKSLAEYGLLNADAVAQALRRAQRGGI